MNAHAYTLWGIFIGILILVIGNIIATEYRIHREAAAAKKTIAQNGYTCPPCPACNNQ